MITPWHNNTAAILFTIITAPPHPFTDTKDKYVIMAHQLGIIKSTSNKKFSPDEALTEGTYNEIVDRLMKVTDASADACAVAKKNSGWSGSSSQKFVFKF